MILVGWRGDARDELREVFHDGDTARSRRPELAVAVIDVWRPLA